MTEITGSEVPGGFGGIRGVGVDNSCGCATGDVYVVDEANNVVDKFEPKGPAPIDGYKYAGSIGEALSEPTGVAVDASGDVYISLFRGSVEEFEADGTSVATLSAPGATGVAVNSAGSAVYRHSLGT